MGEGRSSTGGKLAHWGASRGSGIDLFRAQRLARETGKERNVEHRAAGVLKCPSPFRQNGLRMHSEVPDFGGTPARAGA
jgi:hypothetical protein